MTSLLSLRDSVTLVSCVGQLALALHALTRVHKSPLALPLSLVCLDIFAMNGADLAFSVREALGTTDREWVWVDAVGASLLTPLALHMVLSFVGKRRAWRLPMAAAWLFYGGLALFCASAFLGVPSARAFAGNRPFSLVLLPGGAAFVVAVAFLLSRHLRESRSPLERARTWLFVGAYALGFAGNFADLLANTGVGSPRLGTLGTLLATLVLTGLTLRAGLLEQKASWLHGATALVAAVVQLFVYVAVFHFFSQDRALLLLSLATLTLATVPAAVMLARSAAAHWRRLEHLATQGRFGAQMAHDLRNPLTVIRGSARLLADAHDEGALPADTRELLQLILDHSDRLAKLVSDYQRFGRVEPRPEPTDLKALVDRVVGAQAVGAPEGVSLRTEVAEGLPAALLDPDLVACALENLLRNAFDAMDGAGGVVTARAGRVADAPGWVELSVVDTGKGMDARAVERAFGEFYTTKLAGTGLGLAFVRRVAEAHGGQATLQSAEGRGTTVRIRLPVAG